MVVVSILPHVKFGPNDHRNDAPHFKGYLGCASATYQAPRLIQSIAADRAIRGLEIFLLMFLPEDQLVINFGWK